MGGERIFDAIPRWAGAMLDRRELEATRSDAVEDLKRDDMVRGRGEEGEGRRGEAVVPRRDWW